MNQKIRELLTNWRIILLIVLIIISIALISPNPYSKGAAIRSVAVNSSASEAGIQSPKPTTLPMDRERILAINNIDVNNADDLYRLTSSLPSNASIQLKTSKGLYKLRTREKFIITKLNETEEKIIEENIEVNETVNGTIKTIIRPVQKKIIVPKTIKTKIGTEDIGLGVFDAPQTNIRKGLDLQGGTRVVLQPEYRLSAFDMDILIENMKQRLNVYGLSDIVIRAAGDLDGNQYIVVEIAGATQEDIKDLLAKQGKFEAKIGNETVFRGGSDIKFVCRSADCAGIDPNAGCGQSGSQWSCRYRFTITLSEEAARRQAEATKDLEVITEGGRGNEYLSKPLEFYLDDVRTNELNIGAELKGQATIDVAISGSGIGANNQQALYNALIDMKKMQTILITGSLPIKLDIIKTDSISPVLGEGFVNNSLLMAALAILAVTIVLVVRYKKLIIAIPILITMLSEIIILLGVAAFIGWNIDMAAIAGILTAIGTGVDDQIVITDETLRGESSSAFSWRERIKRAFLIIMLAYLTLVVAMIPLMFAGAGLLKGFALTTIIGVTVGVFITRPAYSRFVEIFLK
ncbi:hypothetical protein HYT54_01500 [Candidatus Woesearchaeota archaeon]|nr:hypothetical protein [Candidatus Woesearchaeota archaeon]